MIVAALEGWVDAGSAGTTAAAQLAEGARSSRPSTPMRSTTTARAAPRSTSSTDGRCTWRGRSSRLHRERIGARDLLVLTGPEPDYRWRELRPTSSRSAKSPRRRPWASLGAIPAAVPHTRPVPILATASAPGLLAEGIRQGPDGLLRVPSACLSVLEVAAAARRHPGDRLFAQVPHYVNATYPAASMPARRARPTPGYRAAGRPARDARARATQPARRGDRDRRATRRRMSSGSRGWSTRRSAPGGRRAHRRHRAIPARGRGGDDGDEGGGSRLH